MKESNSRNKKMMYLCAITGIVSLGFSIVAFCTQEWIFGVILSLVTIRQAIVFPKWIKKLK